MGNEVSTVRAEIGKAAFTGEEKTKREEQINILERMMNYRLQNERANMIKAEGSQEVYSKMEVESYHQVNLYSNMKLIPNCKFPHITLDDGIVNFLGNLEEKYLTLVKLAVQNVLENNEIGEYLGNNMIIASEYNTMLRFDMFCYRWNFTSDEVISGIVGVSGAILVKHVIDLSNTVPETLDKIMLNQSEWLDDLKAPTDTEATISNSQDIESPTSPSPEHQRTIHLAATFLINQQHQRDTNMATRRRYQRSIRRATRHQKATAVYQRTRIQRTSRGRTISQRATHKKAKNHRSNGGKATKSRANYRK
ncbi:uncharacterized protein [Dysidea avara]